MTKKRKRELDRLHKFITRAEKRGYVFPEGFKQSLTAKTTRALQFYTPRKLYELAEFKISEKYAVPGMRGRAIERERAAKKAVDTRRKREIKDVLPTINDIVYQGVIDLLETYPSSQAYQYLKNLLDTEVKKWGRDAVAESMNAAGEDWIRRAHEIIFYEGDSMRIHDALKTFADLINSGVKRTKEEAIAFNGVSESI